MFISVDAIFWRSVDAAHRHMALAGSVRPGRYSRAEEPTLYLSASREGVSAAMIAHTRPGDPPRLLVSVHVTADKILDLRDADACAAAGIDTAKAFAPWQDMVQAGSDAPPWQVSDRLRALGANGLIDPSRKEPGLWHLVLFRWNTPGAPQVRLLGD